MKRAAGDVASWLLDTAGWRWRVELNRGSLTEGAAVVAATHQPLTDDAAAVKRSSGGNLSAGHHRPRANPVAAAVEELASHDFASRPPELICRSNLSAGHLSAPAHPRTAAVLELS